MKLTGVVLGVVVLAGAAGMGGAWYTGGRIAADLEGHVAEIQQALSAEAFPGLKVRIDLQSHERGLFASEVRYRIRLTEVESGESQDLLISDHIEHGPFPLSRLKAGQVQPLLAVSNLQLENTPLVEGWFTAVGGQAPLHGRIETRYDGGFSGTLQAEPVRVSDPQVLIESSGLNLHIQGEAQGKTLQLQGDLQSLAFEMLGTGRASQLRLSGLTLDSDLTLSSSGLYMGQSQLNLASLLARAPGTPPVEFASIRYSGESRENAGFVDARATQQFGSIRIGGTEIGSLHIGTSFSRLDAVVLKQISDQMSELAEVLGQQENPQLRLQQIQSSVEQLLAGKPKISLDELRLKSANGEASLKLAVDLDRPSGTLEELPPEQLLPQLIQRFEVQASVDKGLIRDAVMLQTLANPSMDRAALQQDALMMAEMAGSMAVDSRMASLEGERLSSRLEYKAGMVDFNGQQMPVEQFVYMLQGMSGQQAEAPSAE